MWVQSYWGIAFDSLIFDRTHNSMVKKKKKNQGFGIQKFFEERKDPSIQKLTLNSSCLPETRRRLPRSWWEALKLCCTTFSKMSLLAQEFPLQLCVSRWQIYLSPLINLLIVLCTCSSFYFRLAQSLLGILWFLLCIVIALRDSLELLWVHPLQSSDTLSAHH